MGGVRKARPPRHDGANRPPPRGWWRQAALAWVRPDPARLRPAYAAQAMDTALCPSVREATQAPRAEPRSPTAPPSPSPAVPSTEGRQESCNDTGLYPWVAHADTPL